MQPRPEPGKWLWLFLLGGGTGLAAHRGGEQDGEGAKPGDGCKCPETRLFLHIGSVPHRTSLLTWVQRDCAGGTVAAVGGCFPHAVVWL